jgi:hypothetical protein
MADVGALVLPVENRLFLDVDLVGRLLAMDDTDVVAHLALDAHIGHQSMPGFGIEPGQVAGIGIAVRIAVLDIEQQHEVIAVVEAHGFCSLFGKRGGGLIGALSVAAIEEGLPLVVVADGKAGLFGEAQARRHVGQPVDDRRQ